MSDHVLVPLDSTPLLETVLSYALEHHPEAEITVLHVATAPEDAPLEFTPEGVEEWRNDSDSVFDRATEVAAEYDRTIETAVVFGHPAQAILQYEREEDVDAIVLGSHGRHGLERLLLGSVANTVTRRASVPVTVVR